MKKSRKQRKRENIINHTFYVNENNFLSFNAPITKQIKRKLEKQCTDYLKLPEDLTLFFNCLLDSSFDPYIIDEKPILKYSCGKLIPITCKEDIDKLPEKFELANSDESYINFVSKIKMLYPDEKDNALIINKVNLLKENNLVFF